jgi:hypothetical protein
MNSLGKYLVVIYGLLLLLTGSVAFAADYNLPVKPILPGHPLYRISRNLDRVRSWFLWGDIAKATYRLTLADKYLAEAKTLFELKQFPFAVDALERSNLEFERIPGFLENDVRDGRDIGAMRDKVKASSRAHVTILDALEPMVPEVYVWTEDDGEPIQLEIREQILLSVGIRKSTVSLISR